MLSRISVLTYLVAILTLGCGNQTEKIMPPTGGGGLGSGGSDKPGRFMVGALPAEFSAEAVRLKSLGAVRLETIDRECAESCRGVVRQITARGRRIPLTFSQDMLTVFELTGLTVDKEPTDLSFTAFVQDAKDSGELVVLGAKDDRYVYVRATGSETEDLRGDAVASKELKLQRFVSGNDSVALELVRSDSQKGSWQLEASDFEFLSEVAYFHFSKHAEPFRLLQPEEAVIGILVDDEKHLLFIRQD